MLKKLTQFFLNLHCLLTPCVRVHLKTVCSILKPVNYLKASAVFVYLSCLKSSTPSLHMSLSYNAWILCSVFIFPGNPLQQKWKQPLERIISSAVFSLLMQTTHTCMLTLNNLGMFVLHSEIPMKASKTTSFADVCAWKNRQNTACCVVYFWAQSVVLYRLMS